MRCSHALDVHANQTQLQAFRCFAKLEVFLSRFSNYSKEVTVTFFTYCVLGTQLTVPQNIFVPHSAFLISKSGWSHCNTSSTCIPMPERVCLLLLQLVQIDSNTQAYATYSTYGIGEGKNKKTSSRTFSVFPFFKVVVSITSGDIPRLYLDGNRGTTAVICKDWQVKSPQQNQHDYIKSNWEKCAIRSWHLKQGLLETGIKTLKTSIYFFFFHTLLESLANFLVLAGTFEHLGV